MANIKLEYLFSMWSNEDQILQMCDYSKRGWKAGSKEIKLATFWIWSKNNLIIDQHIAWHFVHYSE